MSTKFCQLLNLCRYYLCFFFFLASEYSTQVLYGNEPAICPFLISNDKSISAYTSVAFYIDVLVHILSPLQCSIFLHICGKYWLVVHTVSLHLLHSESQTSGLSSFSSQYEKLQSHLARNKTPFFHSYSWTEFLIKWKWLSLPGSTLITNNCTHCSSSLCNYGARYAF